jgi:hypothetical protein
MRDWRDPVASHSTRKLDHAGESQSSHVRVDDDGLRPGDRKTTPASPGRVRMGTLS